MSQPSETKSYMLFANNAVESKSLSILLPQDNPLEAISEVHDIAPDLYKLGYDHLMLYDASDPEDHVAIVLFEVIEQKPMINEIWQ